MVVIGPSGNGKSTLAAALAERLGWRFVEGDAHHPPANIAKMARAEPLTDADREPFLASIGRALADADGAVAACSALKRCYRETLTRVAGKPVLFVLPEVTAEELRRRMGLRPGHFMPPALLASQLAAFESPAGNELSCTIDGSLPVSEAVDGMPPGCWSACWRWPRWSRSSTVR